MDKISEAATVAQELEALKGEARAAAVRVCRAMEARLRSLVDAGDGPNGTRLQGLPNLGTKTTPWSGVRVRAEFDQELQVSREEGRRRGPEALCIDAFGRLVIAWCEQRPVHVECRLATDDELLAEDAEGMAEAFDYALMTHLERCAGAREKFQAHLDLALRLEELLDATASEVVTHYQDAPGGVRCGAPKETVVITAHRTGLVNCPACRTLLRAGA